MFSFGSAPTPAFGQAAPASSPSLFGAAPASSAAATSTFGATGFGAAPSPFGGGVATPAFGASSASLFGAASTPSLFGAASTPSMFGAAPASTPGLFGAASTPSMFGAQPAGAMTTFGGAAPGASMFGAQPGGGAGSAAAAALVTKDGRPITHSSKWEDLSPQAQQYLTEMEKVVVAFRDECRQLDADPRLGSASGAKDQQEQMQAQARSLSRSISALGSAVRADAEQVAGLREAVLFLVRYTDTALHAFKRSHAWREAAKASAPLASQDIAGPPVLPSTFLREAVAGFLGRLRQHQAAVAELEAVLLAGGGHTRRGAGAPDGLQALQGALANAHDVLIHTAAKLQALEDRVGAARQAHLARRRAAGDPSDPFQDEERRQAQRAQHQPRGPAAQAAALQAAQQQHGGQQAAAHTTTTFAAAPAQQAASPQGLFGTVAPSPLGGAFGTPLAQGQAPPSSRRSSRRR